jgi:effector-binding domain-containing protein
MITEPVVINNPKRRYAAIEMDLAMQDIPKLLPPLIGEVAEWLGKNKIQPVSPAFFRYLRMGDDMRLLVHVGFVVNEDFKEEGRVKKWAFPAGKYLTASYFGDYMNLRSAHMELEKCAVDRKLNEVRGMQAGEFGSRAEFYPTDPAEEPDPSKWETVLEILLAD